MASTVFLWLEIQCCGKNAPMIETFCLFQLSLKIRKIIHFSFRFKCLPVPEILQCKMYLSDRSISHFFVGKVFSIHSRLPSTSYCIRWLWGILNHIPRKEHGERFRLSSSIPDLWITYVERFCVRSGVESQRVFSSKWSTSALRGIFTTSWSESEAIRSKDVCSVFITRFCWWALKCALSQIGNSRTLLRDYSGFGDDVRIS